MNNIKCSGVPEPLPSDIWRLDRYKHESDKWNITKELKTSEHDVSGSSVKSIMELVHR